MSQLNLYVPDSLKKKIQKAAEKEGKTLSSFVVEIIESRFSERSNIKNYFSRFFGTWEGEFPEVDRPKPQSRDPL